MVLQVTLEGGQAADETFTMLMGDHVPSRKRFIQTHTLVHYLNVCGVSGLSETMTPTIQTLGDVLGHIDAVPWDHPLYFDGTRPWTADAPCMILDPDDVADPEADDPLPAKQHGLHYALLVTHAQDVVMYAREQRPDATADDLLQAFNYYHQHDAFLEW